MTETNTTAAETPKAEPVKDAPAPWRADLQLDCGYCSMVAHITPLPERNKRKRVTGWDLSKFHVSVHLQGPGTELGSFTADLDNDLGPVREAVGFAIEQANATVRLPEAVQARIMQTAAEAYEKAKTECVKQALTRGQSIDAAIASVTPWDR